MMDKDKKNKTKLIENKSTTISKKTKKNKMDPNKTHNKPTNGVKKKVTSKNKVVKEEIDKTKKQNETERDKKILKIIIFLLLLLLLFWIFDVGEIIFDIPSEPELKQKEEGWNNTNIVNIEKDARTRANIDYYLYCINGNPNIKGCKWNKTKTKNIIVKENGINYVFFKAVNKDGTEGKISDPIKVKIDNEAPKINKVTKTTTTTTIKVKIDAIDKESGIDKYYYKIDDGEFIDSNKNVYTFKNLVPDKTYKITIKVVDKLGNEKEIEFEVATKPLNDKDKDKDKDKDNGNDKDKNNGNGNGDNGSKDKPNGEQNGSDSSDDKQNGDKGNSGSENNQPTEVKEIPEISLEKVPSIFTYGEKYDLPSSYKFGSKGGTVSCKVGDKEYKDTSTLGVGEQKIECSAISNTGPIVKTSKIVKVERNKGEDMINDGWITLNLYYPESSLNWQWRLGKEGETRVDGHGWQDYTGPITIKLIDVEDVYIRYSLPDGKTIIIAPDGKLVVDINPQKYTLDKNEKTKVAINYSDDADRKEYRINSGEWKTYNGEFEVGLDTQIDARVVKREQKYVDGELISDKNKVNYDSVYIKEKENHNNPSSGADGEETNPPGKDPSKPDSPNYVSKPDYVIKGPNIEITPTTITDSVEVTITTEKQARGIYYKLGATGKYQKYNNQFTVKENTDIYAYYITEAEGQSSQISNLEISNIKEGDKPYVNIIDSKSDSEKSAEIVIEADDYDTLEYSTDGVIYTPYTESFTVTKNCSIYARAINENGMAEDYLAITYLGDTPPSLEKLDIAILTNPDENQVEGLINQTSVTINYDQRATEKYYRTDDTGWQIYTGSFIVSKNTTVYAYAKNEFGSGKVNKQINYLTMGISSPIITLSTKSLTSTVMVNIDYSPNATIKKYKIDDGEYIDYTGPIQIDKNCTVYAYNKDVLENYSSSELKVRNIADLKRELVLDMGSYYILKLNYPTTSSEESRKYRWTKTGIWKDYPKEGILLIKEQYRDEIIENDNKVTVKDENGNKITYTDNYYIVDSDINGIMANLFMKWDYGLLEKPVITILPTTPSLSVKASIQYDLSSSNRQYKLVNPDGTTDGWMIYTGPITIKKNNTIIYARSNNDATNSEDIYKVVTNIDEEAPTIEVNGDFETPTRELILQLNGKDNYEVENVGYAKGSHNAEYFKNNGNILRNKSTCKIKENGTYTFFVEDSVGNITVKELTITNIDKKISNIDINVLTTTYGTKAEVEIDYDDNVIKQYRIDKDGAWKDYTGKITLESLSAAKYKNPDGTLTLYARGVDADGDEDITKKIIYVLDLDIPEYPTINANSSYYPTITLYGVKDTQSVTINYAKRDDIINYYSLDGGKNWKVYQGSFDIVEGTILAKSVKKISGLEVISKKSNSLSSNSLPVQAYDGDSTTCYSKLESMDHQYFNIDESVIGQSIKIVGRKLYLYFYDSNNTQISYHHFTDSGTYSVTIPVGAVKASIKGYGTSICEVDIETKPVITPTYNYPTLTLYGVEKDYTLVNIKYWAMSVKKQYRIDNGDWQDYKEPVKLAIGQTISAREIDKNGKVGEESSYKATSDTNALPMQAYDGDSTTCYSKLESMDNKYFTIDKDMISQAIKIIGTKLKITFYNANNSEISTSSVSDTYVTIPVGAVKGSIKGYRASICELTAGTKPAITATYNYPTVSLYGADKDYTLVNIKYWAMSVKKQYKIDNGNWQDYNETIKLSTGQTISARGIDKNGKIGEEVSYKATSAANALPVVAYDGNTTTCHGSDNNRVDSKYMAISSDMTGQYLRVIGNNVSAYFYNQTNTLISSVDHITDYSGVVIPTGTVKMMLSGYGYVCEVKAATMPVINATYKEPTLTVSGMVGPHSIININYRDISVKKQYKINNGDWKDYTGTIDLAVSDTIYARGIDKYGTVGDIATYKGTPVDTSITSELYDNDTKTCINPSSSRAVWFSVDSGMIGKEVKFIGSINDDHYAYIQCYSSKGSLINQFKLVSSGGTGIIPEGTIRIKITGYHPKICMITPVTQVQRSAARKKIPSFKQEPIINVSDNNKWTTSKNISIDYGNTEGVYEYSFDAENWKKYTGNIIVGEAVTVYARIRNGENIISTSSYKITRIETGEPTISLNAIPDVLDLGSNYNLPSEYSFNSNSLDGSLECYANNERVTNTKNLAPGSYNIKCTITSVSGKQAIAEKNLIIRKPISNEEKEDIEGNDTTNQNQGNSEDVNENGEEKKKEESSEEQEINEEPKEE